MKIYATLMLCYLNVCFGEEVNIMKDTLYKIPESCDFSQVQNNQGKTFDCTPKLIPKYSNPFVGIIINSPNSILWSKNLDINDFMISPSGNREGPLRLMVSGLLKLPNNTLNGEDLSDKVIVVAINQETAEVYSGRMRVFGVKPPLIDIPGVLKDGKSTVKEVFNIDLVQNLNVPIASAKYSIYAVLGEYKSNVREVNVIVE